MAILDKNGKSDCVTPKQLKEKTKFKKPFFVKLKELFTKNK